MSNPSVSIVIPFTDEIEFLHQAIASAQAQTGMEKEIIVVCNASELPVYDELVKKYSSLSILQETQRGSAFARNAGLRMAQGDWIQFLDVDDLLLPDKIKHQLAFPEADVVVSPNQFQFLNGINENSKWHAEDLWVGLLNSGLGSTSSWLWKRTALIDVGGWNPDYQSHQEYELLFRMMQAGKQVQPLERYDTIVRQRKTGSITLDSKPVRAIEGVNLRELMWMHIGQHGLETPERKNAFQQYIFRQLRGLYRINARETMEKYAEHFSNNKFIPEGITIRGYNALYKNLGFRWTENLMKLYTLLRDRLFPFLPVNR
jgi:glycosyltransferase involved in cell wall biosynthesis